MGTFLYFISHRNPSPSQSISTFYFQFDYKVGKPISQKEVMEHFIERTIDLGKAPEKQRKEIVQNHNKVVDIMTFEETELDDCIQLKGTGMILTRNFFEEYYLKEGTKEWQDQENVGFCIDIDGIGICSLLEY